MTDSVEIGSLARLGTNEPPESTVRGQQADEMPASSVQRGFCSRLTLEPVLAGAMMAIFMAQTSLQNFYLRTACSVDLKFPSSVCSKGVGEDFREAEIASQQLVSQINVSRGFVGALISTCVLLFLGPWSDCSRRRKPLLVASLLGMSLATLNVLLMVTFPGLSSVWALYLVQIPMSLGGNFGLLLAAGFSYIGDVCHATGSNVTMAMGKHRAAVQCASVLGALAGPLLYRYVGFYGVFPIVFSLQLSALVFVLWRVCDVRANSENRVSVLDVRLPAAAVRCLLAPRRHHRRKIVLLMMLVALVDRTIMASEVLLWYMYARNKYRWDDILFGGYLSYRNIVSFSGTLLILRLFKARLRLSDELVGAMSGVSLAAATALLIASRSTLAVFCVPLVAIIAQGSQVVQRPIVSKQIEPTEQGKIYSVVGALEQAFQMAISPLFSLLYTHTAEDAPDAWLLPCLMVALVQVICFLLARKYTREQATKEIPDDLKPEETNNIIKNKAVTEVKDDNSKEHEPQNLIPKSNMPLYEVIYDAKEHKKHDLGLKRSNSKMNESTENFKTELEEELQIILKSVDESVLAQKCQELL